MRCVIGTLPLAIQTNALIEEPLVRVPGGLSANLTLGPWDYFRVPRHSGTVSKVKRNGVADS